MSEQSIVTIIAPVGLSIFDNYSSEKVKFVMKEVLNLSEFSIDGKINSIKAGATSERNRNKIKDKVKENFFKGLKKEITFKHGIYSYDWLSTAEKSTINYFASAEIQSIHEILQADSYKKASIYVRLLTTDTIFAQMAAELVQSFLEDYTVVQDISIHKIEGLQVQKASNFSDIGINELIQTIKDITNNKVYKKGGFIINISGGYKAATPILTLLGQLKNIPLTYLHEESKELIWIDPLPINFDWQKVELYHYYLQSDVLKRLKEDSSTLHNLRTWGLLKKDSKKLTILGELFRAYRDQMPDASNIFGFIVEQKVFIDYVGKGILPEINKSFKEYNLEGLIIDKLPTAGKPYNEEIDLLLPEEDGYYTLVECKSYKQTNERVGKTIHNKITISERNGYKIKSVLLIIHKFEFQQAKLKDILPKIKKYFDKPFTVKTLNVDINYEKATINYMNFMKRETLEFETVEL